MVLSKRGVKCLHGGVLETIECHCWSCGNVEGLPLRSHSLERFYQGKKFFPEVRKAPHSPETGSWKHIKRARGTAGVMNLLAGGGSSGRRSRYSVAAATEYSVASRSGTM